jgi:hypothetical protein
MAVLQPRHGFAGEIAVSRMMRLAPANPDVGAMT